MFLPIKLSLPVPNDREDVVYTPLVFVPESRCDTKMKPICLTVGFVFEESDYTLCVCDLQKILNLAVRIYSSVCVCVVCGLFLQADIKPLGHLAISCLLSQL